MSKFSHVTVFFFSIITRSFYSYLVLNLVRQALFPITWKSSPAPQMQFDLPQAQQPGQLVPKGRQESQMPVLLAPRLRQEVPRDQSPRAQELGQRRQHRPAMR